MITLIRKLFIPIISLVLLILGNGLFTTFVSLRLVLDGVSTEMIGVIASCFYGGSLIGAIWSPSWILKMNHLRTLIVLAAVTGVVILLQAIWIHPYFWGVLRLISGTAMGGLFVVIESWFLLSSSREQRSQALSIYLIVFYSALSLGQLFLNFINPYSFASFGIASTLSFLAILPLLLGKISPPQSPKAEKLFFLQVLRSSPIGFIGGVVSGALLACTYGLAPVFGEELGLTVAEVGFFIAVIVFGGLSLQWPLGKWADRQGRKNILIIASFGSALFSGLIGFYAGISWTSLLILSWCFGGFSYVLYPISMAFACEALPEHQIVAATGGFVLSYGLGAILGPLIAPIFMNWFGSAGLFYFISGICILLGGVSFAPSRRARKG